MFLREFGLNVHPFGISPRLDFLYRSEAFEESIAHLVYGLDNNEAIVMITGAIGTGKTMAIQSFLSHLGTRYKSAFVTNTSVDAKELLKLVLEDLGVPLEPGADKSDLLIAFKNFLVTSGRSGLRVVIVVDEAQNLAREVLEEVRLLTNLGQGDEQPVQIVLVGQPELEATVMRPDLAQLRQRIRVHYKLAPLSRAELEEYVDHRMSIAGGARGAFTSRALDRIYEISGGVPRLVNTLCGDALLTAAIAGRRRLEPEDVSEPAMGGGGMPVIEAPERAATPTRSREGSPEMAERRTPSIDAQQLRQSHDVTSVSGGPARRRSWRIAVLLAFLAAAAVAAVYLSGWADMSPIRRTSGPVEAAAPSVRVEEKQPQRAVSDSAVSGAAAGDTAAVDTGLDSQSIQQNPTQPVVAASVSASRPDSAAAAAPPPVAGEVPQAADDPATGDWFIHVSSFRTPDQSHTSCDRFMRDGHQCLVREYVVNGTLWYRVYLGPFATHDAAVRRANDLRDGGTITYYKVQQFAAEAGS